MRKFRNISFYIFIVGGFTFLMYLIVLQGKTLESGRSIEQITNNSSYWNQFIDGFSYNLKHPLALLLVQIITIILVSRIFGWFFKKIGQPTVIGEIVAGIVLGPSLIGMYFPEFTQLIFPVESLGNLQFLSQIGLILFMFMVGMELDLNVLRSKAHDAVVISHASIIFPFALGMGLAYFIYPMFAPMGVEFASFGLFIGISMSITAFPVLARIVHERGMHKTRLGAMVITSAAADDITAWCLLAAVIAIVKAGSFISSLYTIVVAVGYVLVMIKLVRPFLKRIADLHPTRENLSKQFVAIFFLMLIASAWTTEVIGIHALFGAFMAGTIMPNNMKFRNIFIEKVEDIALVLLLPLFFVYTGLRTEIGLINDPYLWQITALIILVAIVGKFIGSALTAKFVGQSWHDSLAIGALMNTRGLMELVVLNIGYDLGILKPEIFAMMVIMALVTTFMTGPALHLIEKFLKPQLNEVREQLSRISKFKILISFANPENGKSLLRIAHGLTQKNTQNSAITAMHLSPNNELNQVSIEEYESESFAPIIDESQQLNRKIITLFKVSNDIYTDITEVANKGDYDLLLVGMGKSIYEGSLLGRILGFTTKIISPDKLFNTVTGKEKLFDRSLFEDSTRIILSKTNTPVGIFIDNNFEKADRVLVAIFNSEDSFLISYAQKLIHHSESQITLFDPNGIANTEVKLKESIRAIEQSSPNHIYLDKNKSIDGLNFKQTNLLLISVRGWELLSDTFDHPLLSEKLSILIINEEH
jgi:Kef-type K+ transport system membrane component KefB